MPFYQAVWNIKRTRAAVEKKAIGAPVELNAQVVELNAQFSRSDCIYLYNVRLVFQVTIFFFV